MDGVLLDSMPNHAAAWESVVPQYGLYFEPRMCYLHEGRTSKDVIRILASEQGVTVSDDIVEEIYRKKTESYRQRGGGQPMRGVKEVLEYLHSQGCQIWVVTGGGQVDLYEQLEGFFPGIFRRDRMVTALDVPYGKPRPEPYLKAWEKSGLSKEDCCVIENAPLGVCSAKAAGLMAIAVNTGPLDDEDLRREGADYVVKDMYELLELVKTENR